ncbi:MULTISPECIES: hypothetical protein [Streptomyces]|uniref:hypothetical protein n=1 Tax=Streptomyces TaxID=1883 RepID=UPI000F5530E7|nr:MULTISPECIES: hypothetical protein [Streptomyces]RPK70665.1 hypothetical protein EES45_35450 [Streptomyces sp. ADI97-07]WRY79939.1 hypothetical protein OG388_01130 [Streptomyces clavifer]WRY86378.1 hypothetical protein OG388_36860 [Streptomyces clavifer]WUC32432.1 hypothetical protein OG927_34300 [Streptomyces clavifer]
MEEALALPAKWEADAAEGTQQAQIEHHAAETELRAELREQPARIDAAAQDAEYYARLSPRGAPSAA